MGVRTLQGGVPHSAITERQIAISLQRSSADGIVLKELGHLSVV